ncbi:MAG TPA: hypothetical protein VN762_03320 [Steroidobacteraceae bacterium]|nr:hypothetical protein [Steroidobacteraceae bacterium]
MAAIRNVSIHCGSCRLHFISPLPIPDEATFESYADKVTPLDCPLCHRQVSASRANMTYSLDEDGAG